MQQRRKPRIGSSRRPSLRSTLQPSNLRSATLVLPAPSTVVDPPRTKRWLRALKIPSWIALYFGIVQVVLFVLQSPSWLPDVINWQLLLAGAACVLAWNKRVQVVGRCGRTGKLIFYVGLIVAVLAVGYLTVDAVIRALPREIQKQNLVPEQDVALSGRSLTGVQFTDKTLVHAKFDGASLTDVSFRDSRLMEASFAGATLKSVDFTGANLCGSDFRGADLRQVGRFEGMSSVQFLIFDDKTQFPEGYNPFRVPGLTKYRDRPILVSCSPGVTNIVR